jgi:succinyl-diaminopimelate desuccinylase
MAAGIPAVEFGPDGSGHHGPEEWVSVSSMSRYRRALVGFVRTLPMWLERAAAEEARDARVLDAAAPGRVVDAAGRDLERDQSDMRAGLQAIDGGLV